MSEAPHPDEQPPGLRVIVVDDDLACLELLAARVRMAGHVPDPFSDPISALRAMERSLPDVLLTDLNMPGLDGLELAGRARRLGSGTRPYVIVVSASVALEGVAAGVGTVVDALLPKSANLDEFTAQLTLAARAVHA